QMRDFIDAGAILKAASKDLQIRTKYDLIVRCDRRDTGFILTRFRRANRYRSRITSGTGFRSKTPEQ
ncbi:MAG TPA: hypothetical protein VHB49_24985, partial [Bradyrhizobium sp.]|nr:hypothetical protein [Bradyrhizobium sp.]